MSFTYKMSLAPFVYEAAYKEMHRRNLSSLKRAIAEVVIEAAEGRETRERALQLAEFRAEMLSG